MGQNCLSSGLSIFSLRSVLTCPPRMFDSERNKRTRNNGMCREGTGKVMNSRSVLPEITQCGGDDAVMYYSQPQSARLCTDRPAAGGSWCRRETWWDGWRHPAGWWRSGCWIRICGDLGCSSFAGIDLHMDLFAGSCREQLIRARSGPIHVVPRCGIE